MLGPWLWRRGRRRLRLWLGLCVNNSLHRIEGGAAATWVLAQDQRFIAEPHWVIDIYTNPQEV
jgi:hypothetical protein